MYINVYVYETATRLKIAIKTAISSTSSLSPIPTPKTNLMILVGKKN